MLALAVTSVLVLSSADSAVGIAAPLATPSIEIVDRIRREYLHDWVLVTTPSSRYELRSNDIGREGLAQLQPRRASRPVPPQIQWSDIERIDVSRRHTWQGALWGAIGGTAAGAIFPTVSGIGDPNEAGKYAYAGAITGSILGAWIGRWHRTDHAVYVAPRAPDTPSADTSGTLALGSPADSTSARASGGVAASVAASLALPSREVQQACDQVSTDDLLRIEGSFGRFVGHASAISPTGFEGLHDEASARSVRSLHSISWDQVDRLEVQRNGAVRGAVRGALITTAIAATATGIAIALDGGIPSGEGPYLYQFVAYFGILAIPVGTVIGTVTGAVSPYWKQVYRGP